MREQATAADAFLSTRSGQFSYFDTILDHPNWEGKLVLDFGGNQGNLLLDQRCKISHRNYCCIDIIKGAIEAGRQRFPQARWLYYDRFHCAYNPYGMIGLPVPDIGLRYDIIIAYSVFTHVRRREMYSLYAQLKALLAENGVLVITFIDPHHESWPTTKIGSNLNWRLRKSEALYPYIDRRAMLLEARHARWCTLIDDLELSIEVDAIEDRNPMRCRSYHIYHTTDFMREHFPQAEIYTPVNGEMQHSCVFRNLERL